MATSPEERKRLKAAGFVYNRRLGRWMTPADIQKHEDAEEAAEIFTTVVGLIVAAGIFIWIFSHM